MNRPLRVQQTRSLVLLIACLALAPRASAQAVLDVGTLTKYIDPLPLPSVLAPSGTLGGDPLYEIAVSQFQQQLHSEIPATTLWGYEGAFPGPTIEATSGQAVKIRWTNDLRDGMGDALDHILPYDTTVHGAGAMFPQARTIAHVHGAVTDEASDGFPEHWFTPDAGAAANGLGGPAGNSLLTTYPNNQRAAGNWYHDHSMGITRLNVYAGMAGLYNIRDTEESSLGLPSGDYEIPLLIQDRSFYEDGSLFYPAGPGDISSPGVGDPLAGIVGDFPSDASQVAQFFADANLVNGKVWPFLEVEPRKYRFRMLNGANSRFYDLDLEPQPGSSTLDSAPFFQIGTDSGLLTAPVERSTVDLAPADRADVVVDFSQYSPGDVIRLTNNDFRASAGKTDQVMEFRVVAPQGADSSALPSVLSTIERYDPADAVRVRTLTLDRVFDEYNRPELLLDGKLWTDPNTETVTFGELEIWEFVNNTGMAHPMHLHMDAFQVLGRRANGAADFADPEAYELGLEDTVTVGPFETVRIMVKFDQFTGTFVWHCHILEHEDLEMMRTFRIVPKGDYNQDGIVDPADFTLWRNSFGATGDQLADGNNDGIVDIADYTIWRDAYSAAPPVTAAPEPASICLLLLSGLALAARRSRLCGL